MTLAAGDLTTLSRVQNWLGTGATGQTSVSILQQLIGSMTALIYTHLNRSRTYSQTFNRTFDGVGNAAIVLPDYPVTSILSVSQGQKVIPPSVIVPEGVAQPIGTNFGYGYRFIPWGGNLPGENAVVELVNSWFYPGPQNIKVSYIAGYLIQNESQIVPYSTGSTSEVTVNQPQGIWCRDNGVVYAETLVPLVPVTADPTVGQYIPPVDSAPGQYIMSAADSNADVLFTYSFIPADLEEACIQMVAERYFYRQRVGEISKSLAGQETIRYMRGNVGRPWNASNSLPPEVNDLIQPYVSVVYPLIGSPL